MRIWLTSLGGRPIPRRGQSRFRSSEQMPLRLAASARSNLAYLYLLNLSRVTGVNLGRSFSIRSTTLAHSGHGCRR